jgi:hypothetical protein
VTAFLAGFAIAAIWVASLYLKPFGACPRCRGKRMVVRGTSRKRRPVACRACKGFGRRQRPGSRTVHRLARRVRRELARQRSQRRAAGQSQPAPEEQ